MSDNLRQQIRDHLIDTLKHMENPRPVLVTSEPINIIELAITQFPAILVQTTREDRETITMGAPGAGRRLGTITYNLRGYVRGADLDHQRNDLIERIEQTLDSDRYRGLLANGVIDSQITIIEIVDRQPPLAEINIEYQVRYNYLRGSL